MSRVPSSNGSTGLTSRSLAVEIVGVAIVRGLLALLTLAGGFRAISDDDYARTVIAERFAVAPKLDPSGTSWLPFPFWVVGSSLAVFGRNLGVARVSSVVLAIGAGALLHAALVKAGVARPARLLGALTVSLLPWTLWTTAATVPEATTAALAATAVVLASLPRERQSPWTLLGSGLSASAAALSRYETWPLALVVALVLLEGARHEPKTRAIRGLGALLAVFGAASWMLWNHVSHGSATHFLFRVARFKQALGLPETSLAERLVAYPRLLVQWFPETVLASLCAIYTLMARRRGETDLAKYRLTRLAVASLAASAAILLFLAYGNVRDGAPTHHAERALLPLAFVLVPSTLGLLFEGSFTPTSRTRMRVAGAVLALVLLLLHARRLPEYPGRDDADRSREVAKGLELRGSSHLDVTPCAYEHFALMAAFGAPERVTVEERKPWEKRPADAPQDTCPRVREHP